MLPAALHSAKLFNGAHHVFITLMSSYYHTVNIAYAYA